MCCLYSTYFTQQRQEVPDVLCKVCIQLVLVCCMRTSQRTSGTITSFLKEIDCSGSSTTNRSCFEIVCFAICIRNSSSNMYIVIVSNSNSNSNSVLFVLYLLYSMSTQHLFVHINMVVFRRVLIVHKLKMGVYLYQYYSVCTRNTEY